MFNHNRLLQVITVTLLFLAWYSMASANEWQHGKKWAYKCVTEGGCDLDITSLNEQPKLFIGKSKFNNQNKVINIAYNGTPIQPTIMKGVWGSIQADNGYSISDECQGQSCKTLRWREFFDVNIVSSDSGDQSQIRYLNEDFEYERIDGGMRADYRHSYPISHLIQTGNLSGLKQGMIEGAKGDWIKTLQADRFIFLSGKWEDYQYMGNSLNWFYPTIIPLIEAHIVLQEHKVYTPEEYELVHSWLEKRIWALEHGPMGGLVSERWRWKNFFEPGNHETINKKVAYMLWGIADQNADYFTAGFNGFKDFYNTMRKNGSFKAEHLPGHGENYGITSGNTVAQGMVVMAVLLHNQGFDIQKDYPKLEKLMEWASKQYKNPEKLGGGNNDIRFLSKEPQENNTLGWMYLYDTYFGTSYANGWPTETKRMIHFGIADTSAIKLK